MDNIFRYRADKYCWVQTPEIQRFIREYYINRIAKEIASRASVLDLGCGTGWLGARLIEAGVRADCGLDFSEEQILRAQQHAESQHLSARLNFGVIYDLGESVRKAVEGEQFDAIVIHGFLHHLSIAEIRGVISDCCDYLLKLSAKVFILEPLVNPAKPDGVHITEKIAGFLIHHPMRGRELGARRISADERVVSELLARRSVGSFPRGTSPKEMPFHPSELDNLLDSRISIKAISPELILSFLAAQNILILALSYPNFVRVVIWSYLWLVRSLERYMLKHEIKTSFLEFSLFEGSFKNDYAI